jgi:hypothetical protein
MHAAVLAGTCAIPLAALPRPDAVIKATQVKYQPLGADESFLVEASFVAGGWVHLPRQYGLTLARSLQLEVRDVTSRGFETSFEPVDPPREYQVDTLNRLLEECGCCYDVVFRAHTGWGKTYGAIWVASQLHMTTLIVVDQDNLQEQWEDTLIKHFGFAREDIGVVRGPKCDYSGYQVVISTVQTLTQKRFPDEFYSYFGVQILDEVHIMGAPTFSQVLLDFNCTLRLAVSATPKRRDVLQKLLDQHLGPVRVSADKEHEVSAVYFARNHNVYSFYANTATKLGRLVSEVSEDASRNLQLAEAIMWLRSTGRDVIVMSDRTEHMRHLANLCYYMGMEDGEMGIYTGMTQTMQYAKNPTPARRPVGLWESSRKDPIQYTPVSLQLIAKKISSKTLKATKDSAAVLFSTFQKTAKGFDKPSLCGGVDATPRSATEQIHGRILRGGGARPPIWITMLDWNNRRLLGGFIARIQDYVKSNGEIYEWLDEGGLKSWRPGELIAHVAEQQKKIKSSRIETGSDGRYMLMTQEQVVRSAMQTDSGTSRITRPSNGSPMVSSRVARVVRSAPRQVAPSPPTVLRLPRRARP